MKKTLWPMVSTAILLVAVSACASARDVVTSAKPRPANAAAQPLTSATPPPTSSRPTSRPTRPASTLTAPTSTSSQPAPSGTTEPPTTRSTTTAPQLAGRPKVGNCYDTGTGAFRHKRDGSFPVSCARSHTAETFAVYDVGAVPTAAQIDKVRRNCQSGFRSYVGDSATVSKLGMTVMLPGAEQAAVGVRWIRCDAIELANYNGEGGVSRTGSVKGALAAGVPDIFRGCVDHLPKVTQPVHFTSCSQRHQGELIPESLNLGGPQAPFPGSKAVANRSRSFCRGVFQDYVPQTSDYYYYYPTRPSWRSGSHDTTCWALDTRGGGLPPI